MSLRYLSADELLADSWQLALAILDSGYRPDLLIALWRGGTPIAIALHEVFALAGLHCQHVAIGASSYQAIDRQHEVHFTGLTLLPTLATNVQHLLVVDDVFDSGRTLQALLKAMTTLLPAPLPEIRIATPWYKPLRNQTSLVPDFYLHSTDDWLVFPHELQDLDEQQLQTKPGRADLLQRLAALRRTNTG